MKSTRLLMACAALVCLLVIAVQPQGDAKHFTKDGLVFDYANGWSIADESKAAGAGQRRRSQHHRRYRLKQFVLQQSGNIDRRGAQESSPPAACLKSLEYRNGRPAVKAAAAILLARSGRARAALATSAQTSCEFARTRSESNPATNCSGVAVAMVAPDALTARAKSSLAFPRS